MVEVKTGVVENMIAKDGNKKTIAWLSPFSNTSSIGEFSHTLLESAYANPDIRSKYEFVVFSSSPSENYISSWTTIPIRTFGDDYKLISDLLSKSFDYVVTNMGNNPMNHLEIFEIAQLCSNVMIMHDHSYQHLVAYLCFDKYGYGKSYAYEMTKNYGTSGLDLVHKSNIISAASPFRFAPWDSLLAQEFPLFQFVIDSCQASDVIVHSEFSREQFSQADLPVYRLRLPGDEKASIGYENIKHWREKTRNRSEVVISSFGHIQRSKKLEMIIETFANSQFLRDQAKLVIAGYPSDEEYLNELVNLVEVNRLSEVVKIEASVSSKRLKEIKIDTDIFINLRYPNTEGSSGSLIEQLACGKPVVSFRGGVYGEADGVMFVEDKLSISELSKSIELLVSNPELRLSIGEEALEYANSYLSSNYLDDLFAILSESESRDINPGNNKLAGSSPFEKLLYDGEDFRGDLLTDLGVSDLAIYLELMLDLNGSALEAANFLSAKLNDKFIEAITDYQFVRNIALCLNQSRNECLDADWRITNDLVFDSIDFLAQFSYRDLRDFLLILSSGYEAELAAHFALIDMRFSFSSVFDRYCLITALLPFLKRRGESHNEGSYRNFRATIEMQEKAEFINAIANLTVSEFADFTVFRGEKTFDSLSYRDSYEDLQRGEFDDLNFYDHFCRYGIKEQRICKIGCASIDGLAIKVLNRWKKKHGR